MQRSDLSTSIDRVVEWIDRMTSNVEGLFTRHGVGADRVWTRQGDFAHMHCTARRLPSCAELVWRSEPIIERLLARMDPIWNRRRRRGRHWRDLDSVERTIADERGVTPNGRLAQRSLTTSEGVLTFSVKTPIMFLS